MSADREKQMMDDRVRITREMIERRGTIDTREDERAAARARLCHYCEGPTSPDWKRTLLCEICCIGCLWAWDSLPVNVKACERQFAMDRKAKRKAGR